MVRSVDVGIRWLPYAMSASMVSPTWRAYLDFRGGVGWGGVKMPLFSACGIGLPNVSSNAL